MKNDFANLSAPDREALLRIPALITVLSIGFNIMFRKEEKDDAHKLAHLRTHTAEPELHQYYLELEKILDDQVEKLSEKYYPLNRENRHNIVQEIELSNEVLKKTSLEFSTLFKHSMKTFEEHIIKSRNNITEYFLFPFELKTLRL